MKLTLRSMLIGMGLLSLSAALTLGGMAIFAAQSASRHLNQVYEETVTPMALLDAISADVKEVRFRMAGVVLQQLPTVGSANHLKEMQASLPEQWRQFEVAARKQTLPDEQKKDIEKITQGMASLEKLMAKLLTAYNSDDMATIKGILEDEWPVIHAKLIKPLEHLLPYYQQAAQATYQRSVEDASRLTGIVIVLLVVISAVLVLISLYLTRRLLGQISSAQTVISAFARLDLTQNITDHGKDEVGRLLAELSSMREHLRDIIIRIRQDATTLGRMAEDMVATSREVASASKTQSESAAGMATSVEQLSVSVDQVMDHTQVSHQQAQRSSDASMEGREIIAHAAGEMAALANSVRQSADTISALGKLTSEISGIVGVINEIAEQTNLLALNAAIEAARAGEQGRGFAVVADEVRKLAERTAGSTLQIRDMVTRIQSETQGAVEMMESEVARANAGEALAKKAGESIGQIEVAAHQLSASVNEIHAAIAEQSAAAHEVASQIERIADMAVGNSNASLRSSQTADEVLRMAGNLNALVSDFRV